MANLINIASKASGDTLTAGELNTIVNKTNEAIEEQNQTKSAHTQALGGKVDKVEGKGLSTEDYTTEEKQKLTNVAANANNYTHPENHSLSMITETENLKVMTAEERAKLSGLTDHDRGFFTNEAAIIAALPVGQPGWFVRNGETDTAWVWDVEGEAWVDSGSAGASANATLVEWLSGEVKPTVDADIISGHFVEGYSHIVQSLNLENQNIAIISAVNKYVNKLAGLFTDDNGGSYHSIQHVAGSVYLVAADYLLGIIDIERGVYSRVATPYMQASVDQTSFAVIDGQYLYFSSHDSNAGVYNLTKGTLFMEKIDGQFMLALVDTVTISIDGSVQNMIVDSNKKIVASIGDNQLVRFNTDLTIDLTFDTSIIGRAFKIQEAADGGYYFGGDMQLQKLNSNGTADSSFNLANEVAGMDAVNDFVVVSDHIYVSCKTDMGVAYLYKLNLDGSLATPFSYSASGDIYSMRHDSVNGLILFVEGNHVVAISETGDIVSSFNEELANADYYYTDIILPINGDILWLGRADDVYAALLDQYGNVKLSPKSYIETLEEKIAAVQALMI